MYTYPKINDPLLQQKITAKKEFNEKGALPYEKLPTRGEFYNHQEFVHRYIIPYNDLALFHRTGTGKTGASLGGADKFRRSYVEGVLSYVENYIKPQRTYIRRAIIIVNNKPMKKQIVRQIACKISRPGDYDQVSYLDKKNVRVSEDTYEKRIKAEVSKYYTIVTVGEFINMISNKSAPIDITDASSIPTPPSGKYVYHIDKSEKRVKGKSEVAASLAPRKRTRVIYTLRDIDSLKEEFSGSLFIYDELHNLRQDIGSLFDFETTPFNASFFEESATGQVQTDTQVISEVKNRNALRYKIIHDLFSNLQRIKRIVLTATPAINEPSEFQQIMNLILTPKMQMQIPPQNWDTVTSEQLYPYIRGRVSYVREMTTQASPKYIGEPLGTSYEISGRKYASQMVLDRNVMSMRQRIDDGTIFEGQASVYARTLAKASKGKSRRQEGAFYGAELQASNFVFPNGTYGSGKDAYSRYVDDSKGDLVASDELKPWLKIRNEVPFNVNPDVPVPKHLALLSSKYAKIIQQSIDSPGNSFVYSQLVKGSGANVLSLAYEENGFSRFRETTSVFQFSGTETNLNYCAPGTTGKGGGKGRPLRYGFESGARYALLTSYTPVREFEVALETFKSWENRHGDLIKVLIISPIGGEGLDTANVVDIHIVNANWNEASTYQQISRAIRSGGHDALWYEKVAAALGLELVMVVTKGRDWIESIARERGFDLSKIKIDIDIHLHASVRPDESSFVDPSVELYLYALAERKDIRIRRIFGMIKQMAIDGYIHQDRNVKPDERDGSAICDYSLCRYDYHDPPPTVIDYSSYDVVYLDEILAPLIAEIKEIFRTRSSLTFVRLQRILIQKAMDKQERQRQTLKYLGPAEGELVDLHNYAPKFIEMALERIISSQNRIPNRYGINCYLAEAGNILYLRDGFESSMGSVSLSTTTPRNNHSFPSDNLGESLYASYLMAVSRTPFEVYAREIKSSGDTELVEQFYNLNLVAMSSDVARYEALEKIYRTLSEESQKQLFEGAITDHIYAQLPTANPLHVNLSNNRIHQINFLKQWYTSQDFWFVDPVERIKSVEEKDYNREPSKIQASRAQQLIKEIQAGWSAHLSNIGSIPIVNIHSLSPDTQKQSKHNIIAKRRNPKGTIRVFKVNEGVGWRDATPQERFVYNEYLQAMDYFLRAPFEANSKVYGILDKNGTFYMVNNLDTEGNAGGECAHFKKSALMRVMLYLGVPPPDIFIGPEVTSEVMKSIVVSRGYGTLIDSKYSSEEQQRAIEYIYRVIASGRNERSDMCNSILRFMAERETREKPYIWRL